MPGVDVSELPTGVQFVTSPVQKTFDGQIFPLILAPDDQHKDHDCAWWQQWVKDNLEGLRTLIFKYGAILFRDFPLAEPVDFDLFAKAFGYVEFPYLGGVSVRRPVVGNCYTATESPPECIIQFHHEMAHVEDYPKVLFFYCQVWAAAFTSYIYMKRTLPISPTLPYKSCIINRNRTKFDANRLYRINRSKSSLMKLSVNS